MNKNKYDWATVERRIKWIAKDCDGLIYGFTHEPTMNPYGFGLNEGFAKRLNWLSTEIKWQQSLEKRPEDQSQ